jgi:hypothetical protein
MMVRSIAKTLFCAVHMDTGISGSAGVSTWLAHRRRCSICPCAIDHQSKRRQLLAGRRRRRCPHSRPMLEAVLYRHAQQDAARRCQLSGWGCSCQRHCRTSQHVSDDVMTFPSCDSLEDSPLCILAESVLC